MADKKDTSKNVRKIVRLYQVHDLDLVTYMIKHKMNMSKAIYCSLVAFTRGERFVIKVPPLKEKSEFKTKQKYYEVLVNLSADTDQEVIDLLNKINVGYQNNFIKNILRFYLCTPIPTGFIENFSDKPYFEDRINSAFKIFTKEVNIDTYYKVLKNRKLGKKEQEAFETEFNQEIDESNIKAFSHKESILDEVEQNDKQDEINKAQIAKDIPEENTQVDEQNKDNTKTDNATIITENNNDDIGKPKDTGKTDKVDTETEITDLLMSITL